MTLEEDDKLAGFLGIDIERTCPLIPPRARGSCGNFLFPTLMMPRDIDMQLPDLEVEANVCD